MLDADSDGQLSEEGSAVGADAWVGPGDDIGFGGVGERRKGQFDIVVRGHEFIEAGELGVG